MLKRKQIRAIQRFIQKLTKSTVTLTLAAIRSLIKPLIRSLFVTRYRHRRSTAKAGFVLPTVALLLVVLALVIGAILFRVGSRTNQVINDREQQVIYNAATPAIDRAKAKLEYLFRRDDRLTNSTPAEAQLLSALLNENANGITPLTPNPYLLPDETQIQLAGQNAPAWKYTTDVDGDGKSETIAYSILLKTQDPLGVPASQATVRRDFQDDKQKANALVVRNGPITIQQASNPDCDRLNLAPEAGWDLAGTGSLRKTFQVDAVVVSNKGGNRTISTLEFQQDRELARANKWGAWFRYDLHLYPTPPFRWNGAMHTEGSLYMAGNDGQSIQNYLISAPTSCLYNPPSNSEITIGRIVDAANNIIYAGQVFNGALGDGRSAAAKVHIQSDPVNQTATISSSNDSVGSGNKEDYALNPILLFTTDESKAIGGNQSGSEYSTDIWKNRETLSNTRFRANSETTPYVDDTYRADDRLGPKPRFDLEGRDNDFTLTADASRRNGVPINNANINSVQKDQMTRNDPQPNDADLKTLGLDGYWERRARLEGLRIIVGERLELGNPNGWGVTDLNNDGNTPANQPNEFDPLYPVYKSQLPDPTPHLQQQRRTLRDNLAAVQATTVYYYNQGEGNNGYFPVACLATTAHPGTQTTIDNSINFSLAGAGSSPYYHKYSTGRPYDLFSDFFTGRGTNGWEFNIAPKSEFDNTGSNLGKALTNLANFAGEYQSVTNSGAFPPTQDNRVYPDPYLAMWGNFSNLRRSIQDPARNPVDNQISIADQSYRHTAGCALGMLAYNVNYFQQYNYTTNQADLTALDNALAVLSENPVDTTDGELVFTGGNVEVRLPSNQLLKTIPAAQLSPDIFVEALNTDNNPATPEPDVVRIARLVAMKEQIARDRKFGFAASPGSKLRGLTSSTPLPAQANKYQYIVSFIGDVPSGDPAETFEFGGKTYTKLGNDTTTIKTINLGCDFSQATGNNFFGFGDPASASDLTNKKNAEKRFIRLATSLCSTQPKFSSLYYIFPTDSHNRIDNQPTTEPYISQTGSIPINGNFQPFSTDEIKNLANQFLPKTSGNWSLPTGNAASVASNSPDSAVNTRVDNAFRIRQPNGTDFLWVPFLDKGVFDGREMLSLRFLDIDLNRLRQSNIGNDRWFPLSGLIYAFREDAVREDAIARPSGGDYTNPLNPIKTNATNPNDPKDPQVKSNGVSPKPVDFYPDPDRRPYGFRIRNGQDLRRANNDRRGLTFISDNPVAIQGNFNLHSQEEFTQPLENDFTNFYTRTTLNRNFAAVEGEDGVSSPDTWRTAEILTDAIYTLSNNFFDGTIEDGLRNNTNNSYRGLGTPSSLNNLSWVREDGSASNAQSFWPIKIFRDGNPRSCQDGNVSYCSPSRQQVRTPNADLTTNSRRGSLNVATETTVNATFISGTVPARKDQGNGGLNNFPRFLETWNTDTTGSGSGTDINLRIRGSFIQLNFSTYATAPYDQDAFEPTTVNPSSSEMAFHQRPPNRLWGYDVALQYAPAGPLSKRFITGQTPRSEFYEEPKANDGYICNLRKAIAGDPNQRLESITQVNQECQ